MARWINFNFLTAASSGKTKIWEVVTADRGTILGSVKWFGRWRKYAFFPEPDMIFEEDCLRDIAEFCEDETREHRRVKREAA